jgi:hypothetical protein
VVVVVEEDFQEEAVLEEVSLAEVVQAVDFELCVFCCSMGL